MAISRQSFPTVAKLNDLQLLAHLLTIAGGEPTYARESAHRLLSAYQTLERVLAQSQQRLMSHSELRENDAVFLLLLSALMHRYSNSSALHVIQAGDPLDIEPLIRPYFYAQDSERVYAFFLNERRELLDGFLVAEGSADAVVCSTEQILKLALEHRAHCVILAHNHPDGSIEFSKPDLASTCALFWSLKLVGIPLMDHYLLAGDQIISLRQHGPTPETLQYTRLFPHVWFET